MIFDTKTASPHHVVHIFRSVVYAYIATTIYYRLYSAPSKSTFFAYIFSTFNISQPACSFNWPLIKRFSTDDAAATLFQTSANSKYVECCKGFAIVLLERFFYGVCFFLDRGIIKYYCVLNAIKKDVIYICNNVFRLFLYAQG